MQTAESVCLWNYRFKTNSLSASSANNMSSKKSSISNAPYLACTERLLCQDEMSSTAAFYCLQCSSLQCILCEKDIHKDSNNEKHERFDLNEIEDESCSIDRRHRAIFYCPTCSSSFCYNCYENQHQHADGREHKPQKYRDGQGTSTRTTK